MSKLQNLSVPFNIPIPGGMCPGKMVVVQGNIPSMSQRFAINLLTRSGDIAFHVCPKFRENRVVRNNVLNMNWGPEESNGSMPVFPGQSFEVLILCEPYSFKVAFSGRHFCEFSHRLPFNSITNLAVDGEVIVHNVNFREPNGFGSNNNNNEFSNSVPYGFEPDVPTKNYNSGGLYPSVDSYPYPSVPSSRRSQSPSAPQYPNSGGPLYPSPGAPQYPSRSPRGPTYPSSAGSGYPQNPSLYPTQPGYPSIPHQGPYPQVPSSNTGGVSPTPHSKPGFLDQAGAALAGVLGPSILAGGMGRNSAGYGKPTLLDEAGRALAGVIGGAGFAGNGKTQKGTQPHSPTSQSGFLDQAGTALAGIIGSSGLMGAAGRSLRGVTPQTPARHTQPGTILDQAGSALAGILGGGGGLTGTGHHNRNKLGVLGGALGTAVAGAALTGHLNPIKATKKHLKAQKKALKYGLPLAGAGIGAYALHKGLKKGFRRSSSSSSCSSSD